MRRVSSVASALRKWITGDEQHSFSALVRTRALTEIAILQCFSPFSIDPLYTLDGAMAEVGVASHSMQANAKEWPS